MNLRAVETGGTSLARQLVRADLKAGEPCGRPGWVLDRGAPTMCPPSSIEVFVNYVEMCWKTLSIWVKVEDLAFTGAKVMKMRWRKEATATLSPSILLYSTQRARVTLSTSISKLCQSSKSHSHGRKQKQ